MNRFAAAVFAVSLWALASPPALAQVPFTLSGTVFGGGSPLPNTSVEALQDGTTVVVAGTTTDAQGRYSLGLAAGTYDLRVTPPVGSGFGQETIQDIVMSADRQQDVILIAAGGSLSGVVTGYQGQPVPGASVNVQAMPSFQTVATTSTSVSGQYSVNLAAGTYRVIVSGSNRPNAPTSFSWDKRDVAISGTHQLDVPLPVVKLSGLVTNSSSQPLGSVSVSASMFVSSGNALFLSANPSTATAADGTYSLLLFTGTASIQVRPPVSLALASITESLSIAADLVRNYTLQPASMTGTVRGYNGLGVPFASVQVWTWPGSVFLATVVADGNGAFTLPIGPGTYRFIASAFNRANAPMSWNWDSRNVVVDGSPLTFQLPVVRVTGTVQSDASVAVSAAIVRMLGSAALNNSTLFMSFSTQVSSNASGQFDAFAFSGSVTLAAEPPTGSTLGLSSQTVTLSADTQHTFVLPEGLRISGTVRGYGGQPVSGASITLQNSSFQSIATALTNASGDYSIAAAAGTFRLFVSIPNRANISPPGSWDRRNLVVSGPTPLNVDLPVVRVTGRVIDSNGVSVPNVSVSGFMSSNQSNQLFLNSSTSTVTAAAGTYSMLFLAGTGTMTFQPPPASGFSAGVLSGLSLTADTNQVVVLQRPDNVAPAIVAGPTVLHLSDTSVSIGWTTDEPATSVVQYGIGSLTAIISDNTPVTVHSVTLTDLDPQATYIYQVSSVDRSGNGPTSSAQAFFTTQPPPGDITPPVITNGPSVVFVDQTSAIVQWTTDEPATSDLEYGDTPGLGTVVAGPFGRFVQSHSVRITGLTAATTFFVKVRSVDPDGNASESSVFQLTTLTVPDTQAPIVTAGPTAGSITDTRMTIAWTTDEPSSSGVSYNDGTTFNVVNDGAFVRQHSVTLTGLKPDTLYQITVSSTDAVGNGPTLAGPISVRTQPTPDTTAPVISALAAADVGETTATIVWTTDEPATSSVAFGTQPGSPSDTKSDLTHVRDHRIVLTGLQDGTTYYVTVTSVDAAGNPATETLSFTTNAVVVDTPPTAPGTPSASPNPSSTGTIVLTWNAGSDDVGIAGHAVVRDGTVIATVGGAVTSYEDAGVAEGTHAYRVRAIDTAGQTADSGALSVIVDLTAPVLTLPSDIDVPATTTTGADVTFTFSVSDNFDAHPAVSCTPASGGQFQIGVTTVNCEATDAAGNKSTGSFTVTVRDTTAPTVNVPADITTNATGPTGAVVTFSVTAVDNVDPSPRLSCDYTSGDVFAIAVTTVTCRATDAAGNTSADASFTVTVQGASSQMDQTGSLIQSLQLSAETEQALTVKLEQAMTAPTTTSACGELNALINTVEAQRRSRKLTDAQADAIVAATVQIMLVQGCR